MERIAWPGALTPSLASFASSARLTIVVTADSPVVFPTTSSDAIKGKPQKDKKKGGEPPAKGRRSGEAIRGGGRTVGGRLRNGRSSAAAAVSGCLAAVLGEKGEGRRRCCTGGGFPFPLPHTDLFTLTALVLFVSDAVCGSVPVVRDPTPSAWASV